MSTHMENTTEQAMSEAKHTPGPVVQGEGFDAATGGFKRLLIDGAPVDARLAASAQDFLVALDRIMLKAVRRQAAGGDLYDFQDSLRECADIARSAIAKATGSAQ